MLNVWDELEQAGVCISENGNREFAVEERIRGCARPAAVLEAVTALLQRMPPGWSLVGATLDESNRLTFTYESVLETRLIEQLTRARVARRDADEAVKHADEAEWRVRAAYADLLDVADPERLQWLQRVQQPHIAGVPNIFCS